MKKLSFIFLIFSVLINSCGNKYSKETKLFKTYLSNNFNEQISNEKQIFFVLPAISCSGCADFLLNKLKTTDLKANLITVRNLQDSLPDRINVLVDENNNIDRINLGISNTFVIITQKRQITDILEITPENFTNIYQILKN